MSKVGRPPLSDEPFNATLPLVRCSQEMSERMEKTANRMNTSVGELIRSFVDFCTLERPPRAVRSIIESARKTASSLGTQDGNGNEEE